MMRYCYTGILNYNEHHPPVRGAAAADQVLKILKKSPCTAVL